MTADGVDGASPFLGGKRGSRLRKRVAIDDLCRAQLPQIVGFSGRPVDAMTR